jgi:hypothetical protein
MSEVMHGGCLCGQVGFEVREPQTMGICHCTRCQRWTGGAGSAVVVVTPGNFEVTKGRDVMKRYDAEGFADRHFCSHCGSGVYADGGEVYYVCAGGMQDAALTTAWHCQVANKASWDEIGGSAPQFPEWPPH